MAVFGAGPVGKFAIAGAFRMVRRRVIAVDRLQGGLKSARSLDADVVNTSAPLTSDLETFNSLRRAIQRLDSANSIQRKR